MKRTYKYRVYPLQSQITKIENDFSMCRHLYNWNLTEKIEAYKSENRTASYYDQQNALPKLKVEKPWFKSVYSLSLARCTKKIR